MYSIKTFCLSLIGWAFFSFVGTAQPADSLQINVTSVSQTDTGTAVKLKLTIPGGLKLFTIKKANSEDAFVSEIQFNDSILQKNPPILEEMGVSMIDSSADLGTLHYFTDSVSYSFVLPRGIQGDVLSGTVNWLGMKADEFPTGSIDFNVNINAATTTIEPLTPGWQQKSLWGIFLKAFLIGLGALLTPCVYAMLPVTVSFFLKRSKTRKESIRNALIYSASIVGIFTLIGFLVTILFGQGALNAFSSSAGFNIFVFSMFLIFGVSFLGAFEITLPSSWSTRLDAKAGLGSFMGIFFMAATLVVVSFSCTIPFVGALTVLISKGEAITPLVGFFGFSLALALPFTVMALFPGLLNRLAKSGGWLNTLKVSFGFIEIALAFKFLSSADLAYHWGLLNRDVYLCIWIAIFGCMALYLLGKLKFHHDDELPKNDYGVPYLGIPRLFFAMVTIAFTIYLIPGLWGAPLNPLSAWLPEMKTQQFNLTKLPVSVVAEQKNEAGIRPKKYTEILESEIPGVETFFDYEEGLAAARAMNKPVMLDFTGHACANCRKMEREVLSDPEVIKRLQNDFVVISLYVDDRTPLPAAEQTVSVTSKNKKINTIGEKNLDLEVALTNSNAQPLYVFLTPEGNITKNAGGYNQDLKRFISILDELKMP